MEGGVAVATTVTAAATTAATAAPLSEDIHTAAAPTAAPAEEIHDFTGTTQSVENSHIVNNTRNTYNRSLTDFIDLALFLFS